MANHPSVILLGSKPGAAVALSLLIARKWDIRYVVVSKTIGHPWIGGQSLADLAREKGIDVIVQSQIPRRDQVDFVISYMYRHLVKTDVIALAGRAAVNFHAGPLPEYGGWAFYNVAILENAQEYGCTCHYLDEGFDTGPLLKVRRFAVDTSCETACSLERKTQQEMIKLFVDFCDIVETGEPLPCEEQDRSQSRYLTQPEFDALKHIPPEADGETVQRYARAFWYPPYLCAYTLVGGARVEVVPDLVKEDLARLIHQDDLDNLRQAVKGYSAEKGRP